jgi:predicted XRE-type DNA-binding protein
MKHRVKRKLKAAGWKLGTVREFLQLSKEDEAFVELKVALARALRRRRESKGLTQSQVAALVGSSQPRVAFMEANDPSVSLDLLVRTLLGMGVTLKELAGLIRSAGEPAAT